MIDNAILHALVLLAGIFGFYWLIDSLASRNKRQEEEENMTEEEPEALTTNEKAEEELPVHTHQLVMDTLRQMGCDPKEMDEVLIAVDYQGMHFIIEAADECLYINVHAPWIYFISMDGELEEFARMQKAINLVNQHEHATLCYSFKQEENEIGVHAKRNVLFIPQIPSLTKYLASAFDIIFRAQRMLLTEIEKCKVREATL